MDIQHRTLNKFIGSTVQLEASLTSEECFHAKFIGYANAESLVFSTPTIGRTPTVVNIGEEFIVRFSDVENRLAFRSKVIAVCQQPYAYIHMEYPTGVQGTLLRRGQRHIVNPLHKPALQLTLTDGKNQTKVSMSNISQAGASLTAQSRLGKIDDNFSIEMCVENKKISLPCKIRYVRKEFISVEKLEFVHGVEFENLELEAQLFVDQFIQKHTIQASRHHLT